MQRRGRQTVIACRVQSPGTSIAPGGAAGSCRLIPTGQACSSIAKRADRGAGHSPTVPSSLSRHPRPTCSLRNSKAGASIPAASRSSTGRWMKSRASPSARTTTSGLSHTSRLMNAPSRWLPRTPRTSYRSSPHCLECSSTLHRSATDLSGSMSRVLGSTPGGSQWLRSADPPACGSTTSSLGTGSQCHSPIRPVLGDLHLTDGCWSKERLGAPTQCGSSLSRMGKFISKTVDTTYLGFHGPPSRSLKAKPALRWSACNRWAGFPATSVGLATGCQRVMGTSSAYWTGTRCCEYSQHPLSSPSPLRDRVARRAGSLASMGPRLPRPAVVGTSGTARACTTWKNAAGPVPGRSRGGRRGGVTRTASAGRESSGSIRGSNGRHFCFHPRSSTHRSTTR